MSRTPGSMIERPELPRDPEILAAGPESRSPDLLSELLLGMRLRGAEYRRIHVAPPFGLRFGAVPRSAHFHFVATGRAFLRGANGTVRELGPGAAAFLPHGEPHALLSCGDPSGACRDIGDFATAPLCDEVCEVDACSGPAAPEGATLLFSGRMEFELGGMQGLVRLMPGVMLVDALSERHPELLPILSAMEGEACRKRVGFAGILARLADVVATTVVRGWVECGGGGDVPGLVAALREPRLSRAIGAVHRDPGRDWTVAEMARESGTSRSVFAERFGAVLGMPPLRYVTELRMQLAAQWLAGEERLPLDALADRLGYASQAAFSRAFRRVTGASPGVTRRA
ncbi:MAG: AraC family transcriptional regulator [Gluconacetobacter diazotrophicus]|nr:AraC family transcriptional regulator [Gluconacetobacter diazotrophicus]